MGLMDLRSFSSSLVLLFFFFFPLFFSLFSPSFSLSFSLFLFFLSLNETVSLKERRLSIAMSMIEPESRLETGLGKVM